MYQSSPLKRFAVFLTLMGFVTATEAVEDRISAPQPDETIVIKAREAWEAETPDVIHFRGDFQLESPEWTISADEATLHGKLDDPDTIILSGSPVRILIVSSQDANMTNIAGHANRMVYEKDQQMIRMQGEASLSRDDSTVSGNDIEYDISDDHYIASGSDGIRFKIDTSEMNDG